MVQKLKEEKTDQKFKTIKLDPPTHKSLRIYAVKNDFTTREAIRDLLDKTAKK